MDALFALPPAPRADFLRSLLQSFRCTYVSLWQYDSNLSNRLFFFDGFYHLPHNQPTSSLRTQSQTLFHQYRALTFDVNDNCVPGLAFRNHIPYIELQLLDLLSLTSTEIQKQFFQEARIETGIQEALKNFLETLGVVPTQTSPHQQSIQALPKPEDEEEEIVRTLIQVISSTSLPNQPHQNFPNRSSMMPLGDTMRYKPNIINPNITPHIPSFRNLNLREHNQATHQIGSQKYYHTISERRRREKLSESFQALSALLPPGTKKNKGSILLTAKETIRSLMAEKKKLIMRNEQLMRVLLGKEGTTGSSEENRGRSSHEILSVGVSNVLEASSSEGRMVDLQVIVRGENSQVVVLIRLLEFLERIQNVSLISTNTNTLITGGTKINELTFRLKIIEDSEWDEGCFEEAVRRRLLA
ncbi:unnamed protein product [Sphenostylis stenocarpa]|uniref:BHLH domain-containing protein n=1 Tax=Sphenostylis stenocarpa TaxID=92480 RepID=A0AA86V8J8_9FABA|nr:unnamed protein product [Sphenostylis stenocarpa]